MRKEALWGNLALSDEESNKVTINNTITLHATCVIINACWNNVIRRVFGYHRWESVKAVIHGLGRLNVTYKIIVRKLKI